MIYDINLICMGDNIYAAKFKHSEYGVIKTIVEAKTLKDAQTSINRNFKQTMWKNGISSRSCPTTFHFKTINVEKAKIPLKDTPDQYKQYHPDYIAQQQDKEDPRIYSLEEVVDSNGKSSWRTVKHDTPLMNKMEIQMALMEKMFK